MPSMATARRAISSKLLQKFNLPLQSISAARSFNTNIQRPDMDVERSIDIDRRSDQSAITPRRESPPGFFSDVFDPFFPTTTLTQLFNLMDQMLDNPFMAASRGIGSCPRRCFDVKEDENALYLRIDMPGFGKEDVKVLVEQNTLIIKGESKDSEDDDTPRRYSSRIDLPPKLYKLDEIKAEMKNGVLKIVIPKVKEEERKDVKQVNVDS
ncbi:small heat shock protein, chloroplastic-like [Tasmannia lanceolata]|uniref:small heat shock protein, chloroplastic-like n=1 Tax=Tasmannia lanceolata TaxID=3420 RepID=UPI0040639B78